MNRRRDILKGAMVLSFAAGAILRPSASDAAVLSSNDARLVTLADEIEAVITEAERLERSTHLDCDKIPGWLDLEKRRGDLVEALAEAPAQSMAGLAAKARVLQIRDIEEDELLSLYLGRSLAEDVTRLHGGFDV